MWSPWGSRSWTASSASSRATALRRCATWSATVAPVAQLSGPQWLSIAGSAAVERNAAAVAHAESLYAARYRQPRPNPRRVVIRITPEKTLGSAGLWV
jgi:hypothetical protein